MRHTLALAAFAFVPAISGDHAVAASRIVSASGFAAAIANDNRAPAGTLVAGVLTVALELRPAVWRPSGDSGIAIPTSAFAEVGRPASIPGPMLRVVAGTELKVSVHNLLDVRAVVHGLRDHDGAADSLVLAPDETRSVDFTATTIGTHFYHARTTTTAGILSRGADSQLAGAFIVDPPSQAAPSRDRVFVITAWDDSVADSSSRYGRRSRFAINGQSWPRTERLSYDVGDTVRWRVVNASQHTHPMHLHGFYFAVMSHGTSLDDTLYDVSARRNAVTELILPATTVSLQWVADRPGNWLFHCHSINHIDGGPPLGGVPEAATDGATRGHAGDEMAGLVMAISVRDPAANGKTIPSAPPRRRLRLFVTERAAPPGALPTYGYVVQEGAREPAGDSLRLPGSTIVLRQGEPSQITVINRAKHATSVHWHGMELESYYDGVAGWSGADARTASMIAPGDSFVVRLTPRRAGTFIYHTHLDHLNQLTGGLYGALLVLPPHARRDGADRMIIFADSSAPNMRDTPPSMINGASAPSPIDLCAGVTHRLRFVSITALTFRRVRILEDTTVVSWKVLAKDGQELPPAQQIVTPAMARFGAGETRDVAFTPSHPGPLTLEVTSIFGTPRVTRVSMMVRAPARGAHGATRACGTQQLQ